MRRQEQREEEGGGRGMRNGNKGREGGGLQSHAKKKT